MLAQRSRRQGARPRAEHWPEHVGLVLALGVGAADVYIFGGRIRVYSRVFSLRLGKSANTRISHRVRAYSACREESRGCGVTSTKSRGRREEGPEPRRTGAACRVIKHDHTYAHPGVLVAKVGVFGAKLLKHA